jgi:hypothetical protein
MSWFRFLAKVCKFLSWTTVSNGRIKYHGLYTLIMDRDEIDPYLHRYYLVNTRWLDGIPFLKRFSYRVVLHHCVKSDEDGLHDHPWNWRSRLLSGGYWEVTPQGTYWRSPEGGWRSRKGCDFHRLVLDEDLSSKDKIAAIMSTGQHCLVINPNKETWSLFVMGPRYKEWGFLDKDGKWVQHQEYLDNRERYSNAVDSSPQSATG